MASRSLFVNVGANVSGFVGAMAKMTAAARGAATGIEGALTKSMAAGGGAGNAANLARATQNLTRAQLAEASALRAVDRAQTKVTDLQGKTGRTTAAQLAAQDRQTKAVKKYNDAVAESPRVVARAKETERAALAAQSLAQQNVTDVTAKAADANLRASGKEAAALRTLDSARVRHNNLMDDSANKVTKVAEAERSAAQALELRQIERAKVEEKLAKDPDSVSRHENVRTLRALQNAQAAQIQTAREAGHVIPRQLKLQEESLASLTAAEEAHVAATRRTGLVSAAQAATQTRAAEAAAKADLRAAEATHARAAVDAEEKARLDALSRARTTSSARVAEANSAAAASASRLTAAEHALADAQGRVVIAQMATADATGALAAAQAGAIGPTTRLGRALGGFAAHRDQINKVSSSMVKLGAVGAIGLGLVTAAAIKWNRDWTEVTKTVDFANTKWGSSAKAMEANEQALRDMSKVIPASHEEIAQTAALLGTLGVGAEDLAKFTKVSVQLGTTTNLSAAEAATALKQFMTVTGDVPDQVGHIGSALVALGLDGASTEKQIVGAGLRIASAGKAVGFAAEDTLALGSALTSVGIQAEAGGNNMATTLTKIDRAVRGGGRGLKAYADITGQTSKEFKEAWGKDAPEALATLFDGLGALNARGGNLTDTLRSLGIVNIREIRNMRDLALATQAAGGNEDLFRKMLELSRREREKGTKLNQTAAVTYQTTASKIQLAWNQITDSAITAGGVMLPVVAQLASSVEAAARSFSNLSPATQKSAVQIAAYVTVGLLAVGAMARVGSGAVALAANLASVGVSGKAAAAGLGAFAAVAAVAIVGGVVLDKVGEYNDKLNEIPDLANKADTAVGALGETGSKVNLDKIFTFKNVKSDLLDYTKSIDSFGAAMARLDTSGPHASDTRKKVNDFLSQLLPGGKGIAELIKESATAADDALAKLVSSGDMETAGKAFATMAADAQANGESLDKILPSFGKYKDALAQVAQETYGVTLTDKELADFMVGKMPAAISNSTVALRKQIKTETDYIKSVNGVRGSLEELVQGVKPTAEELQGLAGSLFAEGNLVQNQVGSHLAFAEALDQAAEATKKNATFTNKAKTALSDNTKAGRENIVALNNIATTGEAYVQSLALQGKGAKTLANATQDVRDEFIKTARAAGLTEKAAGKLADSYGLIPGEVTTKVNLFISALNQTRIDTFEQQLKGLPEEEQVKIQTLFDTVGAGAALAELNRYVKAHAKPVVTVKVEKKGLATIRTELKQFPTGKTVKITTTSDITGAKTVRTEVRNIKGKTVKITTTSSLEGLTKTRTEIKNTKGKTVKVITTTDLKGVKTTRTEIKNTKGKTVKIITTTNAHGVVTTTRQEVDGLTDKTVYINVVTRRSTTGVLSTDTGGGVTRATGGLVTGPGTPTSDSIPAWLSTGEFVVRAAAVKAVGVSALHALNARGYASGGPVGTPSISASDFKAVIALLKKLTDPVKAVRDARADLRAADKGKGVIAKQERLQDRVDRLKKEADATKGSTKADKDLAKARKELSAINERAAKASNKLKDAQRALKEAQQALADAARSASDTFGEPFRSASHDIDDWLEAMTTGQADLKKFKAQVVDMRKAGLSETLIQQIAAQGATVGSELAAQVLAGGKKLVASLNTANTGVQKAADDLGYVTASGAGRYAAGGLVSGPGTGTSDSISARLSSGEYVVNAMATAMHKPWLDMINYNRAPSRDYLPGYATGGYVRHQQPPRMVQAGDVNFNGTINVIDPDQLLRKAKEKQRDSFVMAGLRVAV